MENGYLLCSLRESNSVLGLFCVFVVISDCRSQHLMYFALFCWEGEKEANTQTGNLSWICGRGKEFPELLTSPFSKYYTVQ